MKTNLIEVFVEENCKACDDVLSLVRSFAQKPDVELKVFDRERDFLLVQERQVVIFPATFMNKRLLFYGEIAANALRKRLHRDV